VERTIRKKIR